MATDLLRGTPVVLSSGDTIQALLASAAIPGVFPPVAVGDQLLVDGGVLANLPVLQAIELGATRLFVLPTTSGDITAVPTGAIDMMQRSMMITTGALDRDALARAAATVEVHTLPLPTTQVSMFDFGQTSVLVEGAYLSTAAWLHESEYELVP